MNHPTQPDQYLQQVQTEIRSRNKLFSQQSLSSMYFGGGTPSVVPPSDILSIMNTLANEGFPLSPSAEVCIEINPGTIDPRRLDLYLEMGVNRFSLGVQSFNDELLTSCGRDHSASQTLQDLKLLNQHNLNFSADILFGLPNQTFDDFKHDLDTLMEFNPPHVSAYNLTLPSKHPMNKDRPPECDEVLMYQYLIETLENHGIYRYELSNFSKPGFQSQHNLLYWNDQEYWGIGVSAHSYQSKTPWGQRFWNPPSSKLYEQQCSLSFPPSTQVEELKLNEALTDFCHTQLRKTEGLRWEKFIGKFGSEFRDIIMRRASRLTNHGLLTSDQRGLRLTPSGYNLANQCLLEFTFSEQEVNNCLI